MLLVLFEGNEGWCMILRFAVCSFTIRLVISGDRRLIGGLGSLHGVLE
jgi:hypothetical protein